MRSSVAVFFLALLAVSASAQKAPKVYDHTGVVQLSSAEPDVDVHVDGRTLVCFGDVCNTTGATNGVIAVLDKKALFPFEDHDYLSDQGMMVSVDPKQDLHSGNPLMQLAKDQSAGQPSQDRPGATEWTFHYRLDTKKYWGGSGYKLGAVFCVPLQQDKNGKPIDKEACYALR